MRFVLIAALATTMLVAGGADAQRTAQPGAGYPVPSRVPVAPPQAPGPGGFAPGRGGYQPHRTGFVPGNPQRSRWQMRDGRWMGGWNAPGGWNAYRRPYRGFALPGYWAQPGFAIADWSAYGLAQPPYGYGWSRYYDDAVLVDGHGSVYDTVGGIEWDADDDRRGDGDYRDDRRPDNGLGGAAIGAVAGGVAGNLIAGRGNRLGGTLIGAGVGGAAGYAIDRNEDRRPHGHRGPPPGYGAGYPAPDDAPGYPPPPPPPRNQWRSPDGGTTVVTTSAGGYYGGGTTTTVVVQSAPVVTTTTTEIYEDAVTYTRPRGHKVAKRRWRPSKTICRCY